MTFYKKIKNKVSLLWHSLFRGLASADVIIKAPVGSENSIEIIQQMKTGGVFDDMLQQKETQRVIETRDKYYRVLREADKWDTSNITIINEDENGITFGNINGTKKKVKADFMKHSPVYNEGNFQIRTIQDNKQVQKKNNLISGFNASFEGELLSTGLTDYDTTISIERDKITPRFFLEKYAKKVVVRNNIDNRAFVDLYFSIYASQFGKVDAILVSNLYQMYEEKKYNTDITDFISIEWHSDKAWNSEDVCFFKYDDMKLIDINIFDGNFVLTFDSHIVSDGDDLTEKFKTKELDEKYAKQEVKHDRVDIFTLQRKIKQDNDKKDININNLNNTILKLS